MLAQGRFPGGLWSLSVTTNLTLHQHKESNMKTPSRIRLQTQVPNVTDGFDHLIFWFDRPELPFDTDQLKSHCGDLNRIERQPKFHANRKLSLSLFQPTQKCLILVRELVGREMVVDVTYAEVARDILVRNAKAATSLMDAFLAAVFIPYSRHTFRRYQDTDTRYCGPPTKKGSRIVLYPDRPSKINNARPLDDDDPDFHFEWRASGKDALAQIGIASIEDLIMFDHDRFWAEQIRLCDIKNKTELGRKLAKCMGGKANASNPAYLKRGNKWIDDHTEDGKFVLHNALKSTPDLQSVLTTISWNQWLQDQA